jgi:hypothetical protein
MKFLLPLFLLALTGLSARLHAQIQTPLTPPDDFAPDKVAEAPAGKIKYVLIMPDDKVAEPVKGAERNPFGKSPEQLQAGLNGNKGTTEENNIREHLEKLRIVGISPGPKGLRVMLGNMVLDPGDTVPPVVPDQTLVLRVGRISRQAIDLVWVEKKPSGMPERVLTLPVDLTPTVRYALPGSGHEKAIPEKAATRKGNFTFGTQKIALEQSRGDADSKAAKVTGDAKESKSADESKVIAGVSSPPNSANPTSPVAAGNSPTPAVSSKATSSAPAPAEQNSASPAATPTQEPDSWKRAVGLLNNLVKLEDAKK